MKNFKRSINLQVKVHEEFVKKLDEVAKDMMLDRSDFLRMVLSNGLAYWSSEIRKRKQTNEYESVKEFIDTPWVK